MGHPNRRTIDISGRHSECNTIFYDLADKFVKTTCLALVYLHLRSVSICPFTRFVIMSPGHECLKETVSYFAVNSKKTSWKTFTEYRMLLRNLGNGDLDDSTVKSAEKFICRKYNVTDVERAQRIFF